MLLRTESSQPKVKGKIPNVPSYCGSGWYDVFLAKTNKARGWLCRHGSSVSARCGWRTHNNWNVSFRLTDISLIINGHKVAPYSRHSSLQHITHRVSWLYGIMVEFAGRSFAEKFFTTAVLFNCVLFIIYDNFYSPIWLVDKKYKFKFKYENGHRYY